MPFIRELSIIIPAPGGAYWTGTVHTPATNNDVANVQAAIDAAVSGDIVRLRAGTNATWATQITIASTKGILLDLNGNTITRNVGDVPLIALTTNATVSSRITNGTLTCSGGNHGSAGWYGPRYVSVDGSVGNAKFRIDNITFGAVNTNQIFIRVGTCYGCIDSNDFTGDGSSEIIHNEAWGDGNTTGWTTDVVPGGADMLFIENNTFTNTEPSFFFGYSAVQSYYGARTVVRYNTMNNAHVDTHGTAGQVGGRWTEVYSNTFNVSVNQSDCVVFRGGSGVIYDNVLNDLPGWGGGRNIGFYEEDSGAHLERYQPGAGLNATTVGNGQQSPIYVWGNSAGFGYAPDGGLVQDGRDVLKSTNQPASMLRLQQSGDTTATTYSYSPYTYPHPVRSYT